jgi:hypothetical protein
MRNSTMRVKAMAKKPKLESPTLITQGRPVTLTSIPDGKTTKYVVWNLLSEDKNGAIAFELKRPLPDNTVDFVLTFPR